MKGRTKVVLESNVSTWLKLAKTHKIVAPKYIPEKANTVAFGMVSIPETFDVHTTESAMILTVSFLKDGNPRPVDNLCKTLAFVKFMTTIENNIVKEIQSLKKYTVVPEGYFEVFGSKSPINLRIREIFKCNRGFFLPESAAGDVELIFNTSFVLSLRELVGVNVITLEKDIPEYHTQTKFL